MTNWFYINIWWRDWSPWGIWRRLLWAWQRMTRGYSERDIWNLDDYLANIIAGGARQLIRNGVGCPEGLEIEQWHAILDEMAKGFELHARDEWRTFQEYEEQRRNVQQSLRLFAGWFGALWD